MFTPFKNIHFKIKLAFQKYKLKFYNLPILHSKIRFMNSYNKF